MSRFRSMSLAASLLGSAAVVSFAGPTRAEADPAQNSSGASVQELIVTATKRPEAVREISGSVSALSGADLQAIGAQSLADYVTMMPGVIMNGSAPGDSTVVIRGVATTTGTDQGQGTTGYFINDVPLTDPSFSIAVPDIDAFDVDHVAVLRGPQGTLFGSASLGGAINYQAAKPDLSRYMTHIQGTIEGVDEGAAGGSGKIMLNVPLITDKLAVRGVFIYRSDPGFIDNVGLRQRDTNETLVRGGRFEAAWAPVSGTRFDYLFLDQTENTKDVGYQEPELAGRLAKSTLVPETNNFRTLIHNLRFDQDLPFGIFTATATYHEKKQFSISDSTAGLADFLPGASPITIAQEARSRGTTFEARLASPSGARLEYLVGVFHDQTKEDIANIAAANGAAAVIEEVYGPLLGPGIGASAPNDVFLDAKLPVRGKETAVFGEATYHFNDQWKATFGGRAYWEQVQSTTASSGFFTIITAGTPTSLVAGEQKAEGFSPKGSITWTPNKDLMVYGLVSRGFRLGGPNIVPSTPGSPVPAQYGSDSLINYELGVRSNLFDRRLLLDATAFYIDWSNIQLREQTPERLNFATNAGKARNYGVEVSATANLTDDLSVSTNITYLNAKLAEDFNPGGGQPVLPKGTTLPGASEWQIANILRYTWREIPLAPVLTLKHRYVSSAPGALSAGTLQGVPQGDFNVVDARASVLLNNVRVTAFVDNLGNSHGVTTGSADPLTQFIVRPRTIGITFDYEL